MTSFLSAAKPISTMELYKKLLLLLQVFLIFYDMENYIK